MQRRWRIRCHPSDRLPMNIFKPCRQLTQRLLIASVALALAGCASAPWGDLFTSSPEARPPSLEAPAPVSAGFYRVNPGDTLAGVAAAFGRDPMQVARWNRLPDDYPVSVGQVLRVAPDPVAASGSVQTGAPESRAATGNVAPPAAPSQQVRFIWPASGPVTSNAGDGQSKAIHISGTAGETIRAASTGRRSCSSRKATRSSKANRSPKWALPTIPIRTSSSNCATAPRQSIPKATCRNVRANPVAWRRASCSVLRPGPGSA